MPKLQVVHYLQAACGPEFAEYIFTRTGLSPRDQAIARRFRRDEIGDTAYYAEQAGMPRKLFNEVCRGIFRQIMHELIRLAGCMI